MKKSNLFLFLFVAFPVAAFAADPTASIDHMAGLLNGWMATAAVGTVSVVLDFVFRLLPTKKPLDILRIVGTVIAALGGVFIAGGKLLDKVLPQNITPIDPNQTPKA